ncbi:MAG: hypothetical protein GX256_03570 [Fretibacterium sp.]|nr:hypothetical protein [Fretibacterium sp.]
MAAYLWPPRLFAGLTRMVAEWQRGDTRKRGLLLLLFTPMLLCLLGLSFSVASFVLFVLPSLVLRLLGWLLLTSLFGGAGLYFYERLKEPRTSSGDTASEEPYDIPSSKDSQSDGSHASESTHTWYDNVRNMRWKQ